MADAGAAGNMPTFKLVLVGDGGTGKVRIPPAPNCAPIAAVLPMTPGAGHHARHDTSSTRSMLTRPPADHVCQAPFDWRVREEVHCDPRCRSPPSRLHHRTLTEPSSATRQLTAHAEPRPHPVRRLGHCRPGEVRWSPRWILHQRPVRYHHVRRHLAYHIQERPQLAPYVSATPALCKTLLIRTR
jgi:hypothetical protein